MQVNNRNITFDDFNQMSLQNRVNILNDSYSKLTFKRKDPILDFIDYSREFLKLKSDTIYHVYKYDLTIFELREYIPFLVSQIERVTKENNLIIGGVK